MTWLETSRLVPRVREPVEQLPELDAQHGVEADGRLVEHEQFGGAEQRGGERDPAALAARERADELARRSASRSVASIDAVDVGCAGAPSTRAEVREVLRAR